MTELQLYFDELCLLESTNTIFYKPKNKKTMRRLVTFQDKIDHPELSKRGISVNQYHDFDNDPLLEEDNLEYEDDDEADDENNTEEKYAANKIKKAATKKVAPKKGKKK